MIAGCLAMRAAALGLVCGAVPALAGTATVVLPEAAATSAGIYDADGAMVRTLWSGHRHAAGLLQIDWDGRDDDGAVVDASLPYVARVLAHDVRYVWEGVIGNTSRDAAGERVHRALRPIHDMAIDARGNAFYVVGYNEGQSALHRFDLADPQRRTSLAHDDYLRTFRHAATDGTLAYFANVGGGFEPESFVIALRTSDGAEHRFAAGRLVMPGQQWGNRWESVIDHEREPGRGPTGLAVQRGGGLLFAAHRAANEVRMFHKMSGTPAGRIRVTAPGDLDVAPDGSLWVICELEGRPAVAQFRLEGEEWALVTRVAGALDSPVALGVSPVDGTVLVADAATEQFKAFDPEGRPSWTLGVENGHRAAGPVVTHDRFWLSAGATYVSFAADGSFWVGDPGNARNLRFSSKREFIEQLMYLPASYVATVDPAEPTRVFRHFLEFNVDYSRPVREGWKLVRNWGAGLDRRYFGLFEGLHAVATLPNGRTYGVLQTPESSQREVVELAAGGVRLTGQRLLEGEELHADGSLRFHRIRLGSLKIYTRALAGFDAQGNPLWHSPAALAGVSRLEATDPYYHEVPSIPAVNGPHYPETGTGVLVSFNPGVSEGFHLGGLRAGLDRWLWRASPSGRWEVDAEGRIATRDGRFETGNGVHYPANVARASGRHIVYGYHGEAWDGRQANQWMHFLDDGLFVGQFGEPTDPVRGRTAALPGVAGNAFSPELVTVNGRLHLWHNDEHAHGGVHRWRIDGTDSIRWLESPIAP